jgi:hypothetical protein
MAARHEKGLIRRLETKVCHSFITLAQIAGIVHGGVIVVGSGKN